MQVSVGLNYRVEQKLRDCLQLAKKAYGREFVMPLITYNVRGGHAGRAYYNEHRVDFNAVLLNENVEKFIERTVPHELAHLITGILHPHTKGGRFQKASPHGAEWREVMAALGCKDVTRCHDYDTSSVKRSRGTHAYKCSQCGHSFSLTDKAKHKADAGLIWHRGCRRAKMIPATDVAVAQPAVAPAVTSSPSSVNAVQPQQGQSKVDICKRLFVENPNASRAHMINLFITKAGCTNAGAATYYYNCKKQFG